MNRLEPGMVPHCSPASARTRRACDGATRTRTPHAARFRLTLRGAFAALALGALLPVFGAVGVEAQEAYRVPPQEIIDILDAPRAPSVSVSPDHQWLALTYRENMPSLSDMAEPMLRLAGRRINPRTNGSFGANLINGLSVMRVSDGSERRIEVPAGTGYGGPSFSPDGRRFTFTRTVADGIELWIADVAEARARRLLGPDLTGARGGQPCSWMSDSEALLCHLVPAGRGAAPERPATGGGPVIQESGGSVAPVRTYQDLLQDPHDETLYEYYMTSQPTLVNADTGSRTPIGSPGVIASASFSPSGEYLLVRKRVRPYSYIMPDSRFPEHVEVWDRSGRTVHRLAEIPLRDAIVIGGVQEGPRNFGWLTGADHTITYVEALDGGNPRQAAAERDRLMRLDAPFNGRAQEMLRTEFRFGGLTHGVDGLTFLSEFDRPSRTTRTWRIDLARPGSERTLVWERNSEDRYSDPGSPVMQRDDDGNALMLQHGNSIFLRGAGASDEGDRPFLDRMDLRTGETTRLFRSGADRYETVVSLLDDEGRRILVRHESETEPPNYSVVDVSNGRRRALTSFPDPAPQLAGVTKEVLVYERADGLRLTGTLYLPAGYDGRERLPAVVWAYPREYSNADIASQVRGSPNRFTGIGGSSHLFFLTQGYAVFDGAEMPIVGGDTANNNYVEQLVSSAQAAVDKIVDMGVADRHRIGVGGHSYGAFMTANLLAHSDIFAAGIARSGAYNRTLTPFGFQSEQRTFWEAPEIYNAMSPFMHAHAINEPMLMIHGMIDNNSGTFPIQSERMYQAMMGHGGTARLVMLPHESHGYQARESVLHTLAEMIEWFDRHVKNAQPPSITEDR
jgi:dipeptidyl aminopeptidase/acylaminoacyl peptidase